MEKKLITTKYFYDLRTQHIHFILVFATASCFKNYLQYKLSPHTIKSSYKCAPKNSITGCCSILSAQC